MSQVLPRPSAYVIRFSVTCADTVLMLQQEVRTRRSVHGVPSYIWPARLGLPRFLVRRCPIASNGSTNRSIHHLVATRQPGCGDAPPSAPASSGCACCPQHPPSLRATAGTFGRRVRLRAHRSRLRKTQLHGSRVMFAQVRGDRQHGALAQEAPARLSCASFTRGSSCLTPEYRRSPRGARFTTCSRCQGRERCDFIEQTLEHNSNLARKPGGRLSSKSGTGPRPGHAPPVPQTQPLSGEVGRESARALSRRACAEPAGATRPLAQLVGLREL